MISLKKFGLSFQGRPVFKNLGLEIGQGELVSVFGSNGSGKTSLALFLAGVIPSFIPAQTFGQALVEGKTGLVLQNPSTQFLALTVGEEIGNPSLLKKFGCQSLAEKNVFELSEGEKQKVNLVSNLSAPFENLLLDEPLELLDPVQSASFFSVLKKVRGKSIAWFDKDPCFSFGSKKFSLSSPFSGKPLEKRASKPGAVVLEASFSLQKPGFSLDCGLRLRDSEKVAVLGLNGSGKTTLLRALAGIGKARGRVNASKGFSLAPQNPTSLFFQETVEAELLSRENAGKLGISGLLSKDPGKLSKGQQKLVSVAAIAPKTIALLDEPTTWLDEENRARVYGFVNDSKQAMVIATHDKNMLRYCDRTLLLEGGALRECSNTRAKQFFLNGLKH